jgi:uncharacterized protein (DUF2141 family)
METDIKTRFLLLVLILLFSVPDINGQVSLTVTIPNVQNDEGHIQIGVYNKKETFPKEDKQFKVIIEKTTSPEFTYTIHHLAPGDYALALMHDENSDGKCNLNILGIPKEGYGFSNNVRARFSAPSFDAAKISVTKDTVIIINLIYP